MGKIIKSVITVAAFAALTVATGGTFLGIQAVGTAALLGGAIGAGLGVLTTIIAPSAQQMSDQEGVKQPITNATDTRKIIYGQVQVAGTEVFIEEYDENGRNDVPNDTLVLARVVADHPITSFDRFWIDDKEVSFASDIAESGNGTGKALTGDYIGHLNARTHDGRQTSFDGRLSGYWSNWSSSHVGFGVAYYTLKAKFDSDVFPYGASNLRSCKVDIKGKAVFDPRKSSHDIDDPSTWEYSTNPALCIYDYLRDDVLGNPVPDIEINRDSIIAAANICDEDIAAADDSTIKRYTLNGAVDSARDKFTNMQTMLTSMGGRLMWLGGEIHIFAAAERTSTHLLDEDVIISAQYEPLPAADSRYNEVRGTFISPEDTYNSQEYPAIIDKDEQLLEGERALSLNLPYTQDHRIAQRLAKIALYESRQPILKIEALPAAAAFAPMDVISISWANFGLVGEDFRILEQNINGGSGDQPMTVSLSLVREESSIYAWSVSDEQERGTKEKLKVVDPSLRPAPTGVTVTSDTLTSLDGTKSTSLRVTWDAPLSTVTDTFVDYRVADTNTWSAGGSSVKGDTDLRMLLPPSLTYEVRVRHLYASGRYSDFVNSENTSTDDLAGASRMVHRGPYDNDVAYFAGEVVSYLGSSYLCLAAATGTPPTNRAYWSLLASIGGYYEMRFMRAESQPETPTIADPEGWTDGPPTADGRALWMIKSGRSGSGDLIIPWSTPQEVGGSGLEVEYSVSGSGNWHSLFADGDLYMRQRLSGGTWSEAQRIIGEKGDTGATGPQGVQGPAGADGATYYTWIRYGDTASGEGISNDPSGKSYVGFAYNKTTATESNTASDYTWSLIQGPQGNTGVAGAKGADGQTTYTWIKYSANSDGTSLTDTPESNTAYIGIAVNKTTASESSTKTDYVWSRWKGDTGAAGATGDTGASGSDGSDGGYKDFMYKRSASQPATPSGTNPSGWSDGIPAENGNPAWESWVWRTASGSLNGNWSTPTNIASAVYERQYSVSGTGSWHSTPSSSDRYFQERLAGTSSWSAAVPLKGEGALSDLDVVDTKDIKEDAVTVSADIETSSTPTPLPLDTPVIKGSISVPLLDPKKDKIIIWGIAPIIVRSGKVSMMVSVKHGNKKKGVFFITEESHTTGTGDKYTGLPIYARFDGKGAELVPPFEVEFECGYMSNGASVDVGGVKIAALLVKR